MGRGSLKNVILFLAAGLTACGGGGTSGSGTVTVPPTSTTLPPPPTSTTCSLTNRQNFAASVLNEWYLFPETLPTTLNPAPYSSVQAYIDALTATARAQGRDRFFTYVTSIQEENAFFSSGSSAGFGIRIAVQGNRLFVNEAFETAPALAAGIDRGTEILAIGNDASSLTPVADIIASQGSAGVTNALGPSTVGTTRVLRITDAAGTRNVTVSKADYNISPLSSRYGAKIQPARQIRNARRFSAGYGAQHACKEECGTREARLGSRSHGKVSRISQGRKRAPHSGSPRGS